MKELVDRSASPIVLGISRGEFEHLKEILANPDVRRLDLLLDVRGAVVEQLIKGDVVMRAEVDGEAAAVFLNDEPIELDLRHKLTSYALQYIVTTFVPSCKIDRSTFEMARKFHDGEPIRIFVE